ncbi:MAG: response regulator [Deltaproteobacteria bacterium]|nr:response regulator [Deltaproteobacteria bacterium]MBI3294105.1 response regulator [Deltaproteobacteria bacterium]
MKVKVLLIDDSLTVQKVVALSLDRSRYQILFAKTTAEAVRIISENDLSAVLVSDGVAGLAAASFPKEVELRLGKERVAPPMILISAKSDVNAKNYAAHLLKPFTPQTLAAALETVVPQGVQPTQTGTFGELGEETSEQRLQQAFNNAFPDESALAQETLRVAESQAQAQSWEAPQELNTGDVPAPLWDNPAESSMRPIGEKSQPTQTAKRPGPGTAMPEMNELEDRVARKLDEVLPGIVERLVQERLDKLLKEKDESR